MTTAAADAVTTTRASVSATATPIMVSVHEPIRDGGKSHHRNNDDHGPSDSSTSLYRQLHRTYSSFIYSIAIVSILFVIVTIFTLPPSLSVASAAGRLLGALICWILLCLACRFYRGDWCPSRWQGKHREQVIQYIRFLGTVLFVLVYVYIVFWSPRNTCVAMRDVSSTLVEASCPWDHVVDRGSASPEDDDGSPERLGCITVDFHMRLNRPCSPGVTMTPRVCLTWGTTANSSTTFPDDFDAESRSFVEHRFQECLRQQQEEQTDPTLSMNQPARFMMESTTADGSVDPRFRLTWTKTLVPNGTLQGELTTNENKNEEDAWRQPTLHFSGDILLCGIISHPICPLPVSLPPLIRQFTTSNSDGSSSNSISSSNSVYNTEDNIRDFAISFAPYLVPILFVAICSRCHTMWKSRTCNRSVQSR